MNFHRTRNRWRWALLLVVVLLASDARAASLVWTNTAGGDFTNQFNWSPVGVPGASATDGTVFTNDFDYTVDITSSILMNSNVVNSHAGALTLNIGTGLTWTLTNNASGANAGANAAFVVGQAQNTTATVYLAGGTLAVTNASGGANLVVGGLGQGTMFVTNGVVLMNQTKIGAGTAGTGSGTLVFSGSGVTFSNSSTFFVGNGSAQNSLVLSNSATGTIVSSFTVGNTGMSGNRLLLSGATLFTRGATTVGNGSSNNAAMILAGGLWNAGAQTVTIGNNAATGNVMTITGGTLTNASSLVVGETAGSTGNRLLINDGTVQVNGFIRIGRFGNGNTLIVSNSTVKSVGLDIGWFTQPDSASSNTVMVLPNTIWNLGGGNINVGAEGYQFRYGASAKGTNNVLLVDGAILTNAANLSVYQVNSRLTLTNGGKVYLSGQLWQGTTSNVTTVTGPGSYLQLGNTGNAFALSGITGDGRASNVLWISDGGVVLNAYPNAYSTLFQGGQVTITGAGSVYSNTGPISVNGSYNSVLVDAGGKLTGNGLDLAGLSNTVTISGPGSKFVRVAAAGGFTVGSAASSSYNSLTISNGGALDIGFGSGFSVGNASNATYNSLNIGGLGAASTFTGQYNDVVGGGGGAFNTLTVTNATVYRGGNFWGMIIGNGGNSNTITVAAGGLWDGGAKDSITVGSGAATGNVLRVNTGGVVSNILGLTIGNGAAAIANRVIVDGGTIFSTVSIANGTDNQVVIQNGGVLESGALSVAAGAGNAFTNSGGVYQFTTATPTITTNGNAGGSIFLSGGTIAFRNVNSGLNLTNNTDSTRLGRLTYSGDNTLRLNNSTATNTVTGGYTFQTGGAFNNYNRLEMVGATNAITGTGVTIGSGGSFLASNTVARFSGAFTNNGIADLVNATVIFSNGLHVAGTLRGNGTVVGATTVAGVVAPGFSAGTLTFSNNFTLTGTAQMELLSGGNLGSSDKINVLAALAGGGVVQVTTNGTFVIAAGDKWDLFDWVSGTPSFTFDGSAVALEPGLSWDTSQLNIDGTIAIIPEPGTWVFVLLGVVGLLVRRVRVVTGASRPSDLRRSSGGIAY